MPRVTDTQLCDIVRDARRQLGEHHFWRHVGSGGVYVAIGVTLREADLAPLVRYYPHGKIGFEFTRPLPEFLERFERTSAPLWTGLPAA